ncbi:hemoglobinase-like [Rhopalosiphum padi]|uniref:hemoglobinase-like n=1 Tax=Rhopalosiphum padi TaxID=40932 RepID=UPI00298E0753|nr:hemoglobinase-like [Rhopalosiphum padi]
MFLISWILSAFCIAIVFSAHINENDPNNSSNNNIWAVLVAGSHRWMRYRHQSNVCHAYKILRANGIPKNRIITFMFDDIAYNSENPEPGVIRNEPNGTNVYEGVPIDYTGEDVRKDVFLDVIQGHAANVKHIGSKRVVLSTNKDNIFIFHTGLGGHDGYVEFPDSGEDTDLHGEELVSTFKKLHNRNRYKNILMYLESSHSAAMFDNHTLPHNINVLAITAGGPDEDTWGTWCETNIQPCLAGLFSYAWMNYAENNPDGLRKSQSVFDHFDNVRDIVAHTAKEHPQLYGDWNIGKLPISQFIGYENRNSSSSETEIKPISGVSKHYTFDKDTIIKGDMTAADEHVPIEQKKNIMQAILNNIVQLVIPNEHIRNMILKREPIDMRQNQCFDGLLSLFDAKCINPQKDDNVRNHQEKFNMLAKLCDVDVMSIQQMTAAEAIEKICT